MRKRTLTRDDIEANLSSNSPDWWSNLRVGGKNTYTCTSCSHRIITLDVDRGVTPMIVTCSMCAGEMRSSFYRIPEGCSSRATHVWYRPEGKELKKLLTNEATKEHIIRGGLIMKSVDA